MDRVVGCRKCPAFKWSGNVLPPWGDTNSKFLIIGQSLCTQCYEGGEPFYGHSGELLDSVFSLLETHKSDFLITNVVLHNPPANRPSSEEERHNCSDAFGREAFTLQSPKVVITLGRDAYNFISRRSYSMRSCLESDVWGKSSLADGTSTKRFAWIPDVHPAFYYRSRDEAVQRGYVQRLVRRIKKATKLMKKGVV